MVKETNSMVTSLSFVNDLEFIASRILVKEIAQTLGVIAITILVWGLRNAVTYNMSKTVSVLFYKSHDQ